MADPASKRAEDAIQRYQKAVDICRDVHSRLLAENGFLSPTVPPSQIHRLQNILRTSANFAHLISDGPSLEGMYDYFCAVELALHAPAAGQVEDERVTFRDLVLAVSVAGLLVSSHDTPLPAQISEALEPKGADSRTARILRLGDRGFDILRAVHASGELLANAVYHEGFGVIPTLMLHPDEALRLPLLIFPGYMGTLPAIYEGAQADSRSNTTRDHTNNMTAMILVSLAKRFQDGVSGVDIPVRGTPLRVSPSLVLLLYYLALALSPSPSLYNNVGVVLSGLSSLTYHDVTGTRQIYHAQDLASAYYEMGLQMDPTHPHLLTNYGSLLKDKGRTDEAIQSVYHDTQSYSHANPDAQYLHSGYSLSA